MPEVFDIRRDKKWDDEWLSMVKKSMDLFVSSLSDGSLDRFNGGISRIWRHQFSVEDLNEAYRVILRLADNLQFILDQEPVIESALGQDEAGEWTVNGFHEDKSGVFHINLVYIFEPNKGEWKLTGLSARFG